MFKLPLTRDLSGTLHSISALDIINPTINKHWVVPVNAPTKLTPTYTKAFLKLLFTRDHIKQYPFLLIHGLYNHYSDIVPKVTTVIDGVLSWFDNDDLWLLAFMMFQGQSRYLNYEYFMPRSVGNDSRVCAYGWVDSYYESPNNSLINDENVAEMKKIIAKLKKAWNEQVFENPEVKDKYNNNFSQHVPNHFADRLFVLAQNQKMYTTVSDHSRNYLTPSKLSALMAEDDSINFANEHVYQHSSLPWMLQSIIPYKQNITKRNRRPLYSLLSYSASPTSMLAWPILAGKEHKPVLYGVELEIATNYEIKDIIDNCNELFLIAKSDGSVNGAMPNKMELVTVPMSLRAHKREWAYLFSKLDYNNFDTSKDTNNGMHVHIDKTAFVSQQHINNMAWFIANPANFKFLLEMSERTESSWNHYSPTPHIDGTRVRNYKGIQNKLRGIRGAFNLGTNKPTIEVRLFRGIVSYAAVLKNLEFVDSLFHFCMDRNLQGTTLKHYLRWIETQPSNRYQVLRKFLGTYKDMASVIAYSEVKDIVFSERNPVKIISKLEKSSLKLTSQHIMALNRTMKKRTFVMNKRTGKLEVLFTNQSPLAHMDRALEKNYANMSR